MLTLGGYTGYGCLAVKDTVALSAPVPIGI
jgi:hypothetical protein